MIVSKSKLKKYPEFDEHRLVMRIEDKESGLKCFIAIHNDNLGSATGGTRMYDYRSEEEALLDVLRLSRAMTYKCALAGVKFGGGKGVIIGDPKKDKSEDLLRSYARKVNELGGKFTTGEDVGITEDDVQLMLEESPYFNGKRGLGGDPSPYTALGNFYAIQTAATEVFGSDDLSGKTVAVKGVGKVGSELVKLLIEEGINVYIADIDSMALDRVVVEYPHVKVVDPVEIHRLKVDIYAPCALGNEFTQKNKKEVKAKIICGSANNQLLSPDIGEWFFQNSVLYIPDYVANAGGLINVVDELEESGYQKERVLARIENIKDTVLKILELSRKRKKSLNLVADELAKQVFDKAKS